MRGPLFSFFFFFNDTATTEIYTLSLHDALPICRRLERRSSRMAWWGLPSGTELEQRPAQDRKSTRLNSSHGYISYAVFCLKKKKMFRDVESIEDRLRIAVENDFARRSRRDFLVH